MEKKNNKVHGRALIIKFVIFGGYGWEGVTGIIISYFSLIYIAYLNKTFLFSSKDLIGTN